MTALPDIPSPQRSEHTRSRFSIDCAGAQLNVHARRLATVLRLEGEIDAANAALVGQTMCRFAQLNAPLIIDLGQLSFLGIAGFRMLLAFNEQNQKTGRCCQVVTGSALRLLTRVITNCGLPVVDSVSEALVRVEEATRMCRRPLYNTARQREPERSSSST